LRFGGRISRGNITPPRASTRVRMVSQQKRQVLRHLVRKRIDFYARARSTPPLHRALLLYFTVFLPTWPRICALSAHLPALLLRRTAFPDTTHGLPARVRAATSRHSVSWHSAGRTATFLACVRCFCNAAANPTPRWRVGALGTYERGALCLITVHYSITYRARFNVVNSAFWLDSPRMPTPRPTTARTYAFAPDYTF